MVALQIILNPFVNDREICVIRMDAYAAILDGESIADVRYTYDRQMDAYLARTTGTNDIHKGYTQQNC